MPHLPHSGARAAALLCLSGWEPNTLLATSHANHKPSCVSSVHRQARAAAWCSLGDRCCLLLMFPPPRASPPQRARRGIHANPQACLFCVIPHFGTSRAPEAVKSGGKVLAALQLQYSLQSAVNPRGSNPGHRGADRQFLRGREEQDGPGEGGVEVRSTAMQRMWPGFSACGKDVLCQHESLWGLARASVHAAIGYRCRRHRRCCCRCRRRRPLYCCAEPHTRLNPTQPMLLVLVLRPLQQLAEELLEASRTGDTAAVLALLDAGADREASDMGGCAALHWAARNGHTATVQVLLGAGAECDATFTTHVSPTSGRTPLHWAAQHGHTDAVQALLRVAADTEARDSESRTPLHQLGARNGHTETVLKLLNGGAAIGATDSGGCSALHQAAGQGHSATVHSRGGDPAGCRQV